MPTNRFFQLQRSHLPTTIAGATIGRPYTLKLKGLLQHFAASPNYHKISDTISRKEPGEPNGLTITTGQPVPNCLPGRPG